MWAFLLVFLVWTLLEAIKHLIAQIITHDEHRRRSTFLTGLTALALVSVFHFLASEWSKQRKALYCGDKRLSQYIIQDIYNFDTCTSYVHNDGHIKAPQYPYLRLGKHPAAEIWGDHIVRIKESGRGLHPSPSHRTNMIMLVLLLMVNSCLWLCFHIYLASLKARSWLTIFPAI